MTQKPTLAAGNRPLPIVPADIEQAFRLARAIAAARWAPKSYLSDPKNSDSAYDENKILLGIMHGLEVGLTPIAALQSIAVINNVPAIWGDGALAIIQASGLMESLQEEPIFDPQQDPSKGQRVIGYRCTVKRRGLDAPISHSFTLQDAAAAKLLEKSGPWQHYRSRMLQMRARSWTLRAAFADVLRGLTIAEEAGDILDVTPPTQQAAITRTTEKKTAASALDAFAAKPNKPQQLTSGDVLQHEDFTDGPPDEFAYTKDRHPSEERAL